MRLRTDYILTKEEVHGYTNHWLSSSMKLVHEGTKCTASILHQVLLIAASRMASVFAACLPIIAKTHKPNATKF